VIRVRFPDHHTLEVTFHPSETIQSLVDLLMKVVARPELPFYICMPIDIKIFICLSKIGFILNNYLKDRC
jgi:hypothetical protein